MTGKNMIDRVFGASNPVEPQPESASENQRGFHQILMLVVLVAGGVTLRVLLRDLPNFAPVAALALFAGYFFQSAALALCVPLAVMAISDWFLGGYSWYMMALVYGMLAVPVLLGPWLRQAFCLRKRGMAGSMFATTGLVGCSLVSSVVFFLVTNFGVWLWFGAYEPTLGGLWHCFVAAVPFFRYTLAGDLVFSVVLFGSYATALAMAQHREPVAQVA